MKSGVMGKLFRAIVDLPGRVLIIVVRLYQWLLSPLLGRHCRFEPSCSRYFIGAVQKYGAIRGTWLGIVRICRCHPWNPGGYDPP
jgi:putative membrane protein insertion efficiency factor